MLCYHLAAFWARPNDGFGAYGVVDVGHLFQHLSPSSWATLGSWDRCVICPIVGGPGLSGGALPSEEGRPGRGDGDQDDGGDVAEVENLVEDGKADQGRHSGFQAH